MSALKPAGDRAVIIQVRMRMRRRDRDALASMIEGDGRALSTETRRIMNMVALHMLAGHTNPETLGALSKVLAIAGKEQGSDDHVFSTLEQPATAKLGASP